MQNNQQNQGNQFYQQLSIQTSNHENQLQSNAQIDPNQGNQPQINGQMNLPQDYPKQSEIQTNSPQNLNCPPNFPQNIPTNPYYPYNPFMLPNQQLMQRPEALFEMQKRMMAGERVNLLNFNQQSNNNFVLPPSIKPSGDKLIIPFTLCFNIFIEVFIIITYGIVLGVVPTIAKIYSGVIFLVEQILLLYFSDKRLEIIKDVPNKKLKVNLINFLCCARKKKEFDLQNIFIDVQIVDRKEGWQTPAYYRLILINTFKDGIMIDLNSSNIQNTPVTIFDFHEHINAQKFNGQNALKQTLNSFLGNNNDDEQINPLSFNINKYMNKQDDIFRHFNNFINGVSFSKYVKFNDHFFSLYSKEPLKNKFCQGCFIRLLIFFHFYLFPLTFVSTLILPSSKSSSMSSTNRNKNSKNTDENESLKETYFAAGFFGFIAFMAILYFLCIGLGKCCDKTTEYLRIDIIYSKNFDRLFIGIVSNNETVYIKKFLFNIDEIDKFVIQKNDINERGFHLKSIIKRNNLIQDICYINEVQSELEGLLYILNEKLLNNANDIDNQNIADNNNNNIDLNTNDCPPSTTPLIDKP